MKIKFEIKLVRIFSLCFFKFNKIVANLVYHEWTKHNEVDCHSIRKTYDRRVISLPHDSTSVQIADIFTKTLTRQRHNFLLGKLMLVDLPASI